MEEDYALIAKRPTGATRREREAEPEKEGVCRARRGTPSLALCLDYASSSTTNISRAAMRRQHRLTKTGHQAGVNINFQQPHAHGKN